MLNVGQKVSELKRMTVGELLLIPELRKPGDIATTINLLHLLQHS